LALAVVVVAFVAVVLAQPSTFQVERSAEMKAPADIVFGYVEDLHRWSDWSPWDKLDPAQKKTYEGAEKGKGAIFAWSGNDQVGEGRMTITDARANEAVDVKLEFLKPWKSTNDVTFRLAASGDATKVTWRMEGEADFLGKAMSLFMDMDAMVGKDFEAGLATLKGIAEDAARKRAEEEEALRAAAAAAEAADHDTYDQTEE
ncbi:MAG TPA: SRPBCC family protein, partial [Vulgatibacter sp.]